MPKQGIQEVKKPYSTPVLTIYGTVQQLTHTRGLRATKDGGKFPHIKNITTLKRHFGCLRCQSELNALGEMPN
jgi:hypothetical protein